MNIFTKTQKRKNMIALINLFEEYCAVCLLLLGVKISTKGLLKHFIIYDRHEAGLEKT